MSGERLALVTGCFGYLGRQVVRRLATAGWRVVGIGHGTDGVPLAETVEADVDLAGLRALIAEKGAPRLVVHCAGTGSVGAAAIDPHREFRRSVGATADVIEAIRLDAPEAVLVYPSSAAVYGGSAQPSRETDPLRPVSAYGAHKVACEELVRSASRDLGLTTRIVRFFSLYGEGLRKQLLWDACQRLAGDPRELVLFGTGEESRDFMHGSDAARLIERLADPCLGRFVLVNGGTGRDTPVRRIAELLVEGLGVRTAIRFGGESHEGNPAHLVADVTELGRITGFAPAIELETGIRDYANWAVGSRIRADAPLLTVMVGTYERKADLADLLDTIALETRIPHRIVVTDAGSRDGTLEMLAARGQNNLVVVHEGEKRGQARALNDVLATIETPYVCWLSDDNLVVNHGLDRAVEILQGRPAIGMVGLKVKDLVGPFARAPYIGGIGVAGVLNVNQGVLPTALLQRLGGFDEELRDYGIDPDLTLRVLRAGYEVVYTRALAVLHRRGWPDDPQSPEGQRLAAKHTRAREILARKHRDLHAQPKDWQRKVTLWKLARAVPMLRRRLVLNGGKPFLGQLPRDWYNAFNARWVAPWDPWFTRHLPYHLVQRMPEPAPAQAKAPQKAKA